MPYKDREGNLQYFRRRYEKNKEVIRAQQKEYWVHYGRFRFHGMTEAEFYDLYHSQDGKCAICKKDIPLKGKETHIDHNHETGKIRGLLCAKCNKGLGHFEDSVATLESAIGYLLYNQEDVVV